MHVMSQILQDKGDVKGAEGMLRDLIANDPLDAIALNSLGYMLAERGDRLEEAVTLLQRALKVEPDNPSYLDSLGWAYFRQGRVDLADPPLTQAAAKLTTAPSCRIIWAISVSGNSATPMPPRRGSERSPVTGNRSIA